MTKKNHYSDADEDLGKIEIKNKFIEFRAKGMSLRSIAKKLNISPSTLCAWQGELEIDIAQLKALELETLCERYRLLKEHRIKLLGDQIAAIEGEIAKRDFSEVALDKLLDLLLKYLSQAEHEYSEPRFLSPRSMNKTVTKSNDVDPVNEMKEILARYRFGLIGEKDAKQELAVLMGILKAEEQTELREKIDKLTVLVGGK